MISNRSIQLKAAFLLVVFSLNTLVGFACTMGLNMGFNSNHHKEEAVKVQIHTHKDGKKHEHKNPQHSHKESSNKKDDCCKEKVVKLQIADKNLDYSKPVIIQPVTYLPGIFYQLPLYTLVTANLQEFIACQFHPPPRDIRIDIQSFQI